MKKVLFILLLSQCALAQQKQKAPHRFMGFGFNLATRQSTEFILNVDPISHFRAEFRYGQMNSTREVFLNNGSTTDLKSAYRTMRLGLFGLLPLDNMLMFGGFRYTWSKSSRQNIYYENLSTYLTDFNYLTNQIETVLGSEYRFANRLALGAEIAFCVGKTDYSSTAPNSQRGTNKQNYFRTTAFIRFFPF